jgi:hypothetical protein
LLKLIKVGVILNCFHKIYLLWRKLGLDEIVVISDGKGRNNQLAMLLKKLFPECKITVSKKDKGETENVDRKGFQYAENP